MVSRTQAVHDLIVTLADSVDGDAQQQDLPQILANGAAAVLKADAAVLLDSAGRLTVAAAHGAGAADLAAIEADSGLGPSTECFRDGSPVSCASLDGQTPRWPQWSAQARAAGFTAVHSRPLRRRRQRIGVLTLLVGGASPPLTGRQLSTAQALADAAAVGLLHQRLVKRQTLIAAQLRFALDSRILIEQAKGILAERAGTGVDEAFQLLREYARNHGRKIHEVAADVVHEGLRIQLSTGDRPPAAQ